MKRIYILDPLYDWPKRVLWETLVIGEIALRLDYEKGYKMKTEVIHNLCEFSYKGIAKIFVDKLNDDVKIDAKTVENLEVVENSLKLICKRKGCLLVELVDQVY